MAAVWCVNNECEQPECHRCYPVVGCAEHEKCREETKLRRKYRVLYVGSSELELGEQVEIGDMTALALREEYANPIVLGEDGEFYTLRPRFVFEKADPDYVRERAEEVDRCHTHFMRRCDSCDECEECHRYIPVRISDNEGKHHDKDCLLRGKGE